MISITQLVSNFMVSFLITVLKVIDVCVNKIMYFKVKYSLFSTFYTFYTIFAKSMDDRKKYYVVLSFCIPLMANPGSDVIM